MSKYILGIQGWANHDSGACMIKYSNKKPEIIVSDWARQESWLRNAPGYNYQMFDYIKEKLNFNKKKNYSN